MKVRDLFELVYCSNVHPGENWVDTFSQLKQYILPLKENFSPQEKFGIGLRLSNRAAIELLQGDYLIEFEDWLCSHNLYVLTINGFVYNAFHGMPVKAQVYAPDWSTLERFTYSSNIIKILNHLTPPGEQRGFSTLPLSYRSWIKKAEQEVFFHKAISHLIDLVMVMIPLYEQDGKHLHIDIEPEPDCLLDTMEDVVAFFHNWLFPIGIKSLKRLLGISSELAETYIRRHINVCYDICHSSVLFENPVTLLERFAREDIRIGKIQVSNALKVHLPSTENEREKLFGLLSPFAEGTYLHQVIGRCPNGQLIHYADLPEALLDVKFSPAEEWRIHFHVPLFIDTYQSFHSTQNDILTAFQWLKENKITPHLEIETYTWGVLPPELKLDLLASLEREYRWVIEQV